MLSEFNVVKENFHIHENDVMVYEVNLCFEKEAFDEHGEWFLEHIHDMAGQAGFLKTTVNEQVCFDLSNDEHLRKKRLTIRYYIKNIEFLQAYLNQSASSMRNQVVERFKNRYSAERRIFKLKSIIGASDA